MRREYMLLNSTGIVREGDQAPCSTAISFYWLSWHVFLKMTIYWKAVAQRQEKNIALSEEVTDLTVKKWLALPWLLNHLWGLGNSTVLPDEGIPVLLPSHSTRHQTVCPLTFPCFKTLCHVLEMDPIWKSLDAYDLELAFWSEEHTSLPAPCQQARSYS